MKLPETPKIFELPQIFLAREARRNLLILISVTSKSKRKTLRYNQFFQGHGRCSGKRRLQVVLVRTICSKASSFNWNVTCVRPRKVLAALHHFRVRSLTSKSELPRTVVNLIWKISISLVPPTIPRGRANQLRLAINTRCGLAIVRSKSRICLAKWAYSF